MDRSVTSAVKRPHLHDLPPAPVGFTGWPWDVVDHSRDLMDGNLPLVSIVIPNYNHGRYLEHAIRSVLLQSYPRLECLVMDGGSTDGSVDVIRKYEPWLSHWVSEGDDGQSSALNRGFDQAAGSVFGWMCADDYFLPGAVGLLMKQRAESPESVAWVAACQVVDENDQPIEIVAPRLPGSPQHMGDWGRRAWFYQPSCLFAADAFQRVGRLDEKLHFAMDVDLWVRLAADGGFSADDCIVSCARSYPQAKTRRDIPMREAEIIALNVNNGRSFVARERILAYADRRLEGMRCRLEASEAGRAALEQELWPLSRLCGYTLRRISQSVGRRMVKPK